MAERAKPGDAIALIGGLGSGKTVFCQAFGKAVGAASTLRSPSFVVVTQHAVKRGAILRLYHADLYRLARRTRRDNEVLLEALADRRGVTLIEWADRCKDLLPSNATTIRFAVLGPASRRLTIVTTRSRASGLALLARRPS